MNPPEDPALAEIESDNPADSPGPGHSDRHHAEDERRLLRRAMAASHVGITIGVARGGAFPLIYANPAFCRLSGYDAGEVIGQDCRFLQRDQTNQPALRTLREAMARQERVTVLLRNYRKDGSVFWNELRMSPVLGPAGGLTHYVGIQQDVTERENQQAAVAALNQALAQRGQELEQANAGLQAFSSSASHDLRAPLGSIKGFCAALRKSAQLPQDGRAAHYLERIEANADRMSQLVEALLKLAQSSVSPLMLAHCDLSEMAREVVEALQAAAPQPEAQMTTPQPVRVQIEPGLLARGDPALLRSVLHNLLGNALKYSSRTPGAQVCFGREAGAGGQARFFVRDNGAGFDMRHASALFDAFQRLHPEADYPGTGIGLATVHRIVTRHGGTVSADSVPGRGAVFYFTLGAPEA